VYVLVLPYFLQQTSSQLAFLADYDVKMMHVAILSVSDAIDVDEYNQLGVMLIITNVTYDVQTDLKVEIAAF